MGRSIASTFILTASDRLRERAEWQDWYKCSCKFLLNTSLQDAIAINVSPLVICKELLANHQQGHTSTAKASAKAKQGLQRALHDALLHHRQLNSNHEARVGLKMKRWKFLAPEDILSRRLLNTFPKLPKLVAPKVQAACWKAAYKGWCVDARFIKMTQRHETKQYFSMSSYC